MTRPTTIAQVIAQLQAGHELAAALELRPMLAVGLALLDDDDFVAVARKAKQYITQRAVLEGFIAAGDVEKAG